MSANKLSPIETLNLDVLIDYLIPRLDLKSTLNLSSTNESFYDLIQRNNSTKELIWRRKISVDFNFPLNSTGRKHGWFELYKKLEKQQLYTFGATSHSRLGLPPTDEVQSMMGGSPVPKLVTNIPKNQSIISIQASGWSNHCVTTKGEIIVWGCMDGEGWAGREAPFSHPSRVIQLPIVLMMSSSMGTIVQLETGRKHAVCRNEDGDIYEYHSFGRAFKVILDDFDNSAKLIQVEAGWESSLALFGGGHAYIWWRGRNEDEEHDRLAQTAGEGRQGITYSSSVNSVRLPDLPVDEDDPSLQETIIQIAAMDNRIIALSSGFKVYAIDVSPLDLAVIQNNPTTRFHRDKESIQRLAAAFTSRVGNGFEREWIYLPKFCNISAINSLASLRDEQIEVTSSMRITHISAHFHSFVVYSVPTSGVKQDSIVLIGNNNVDRESTPLVIPELQGISVIKVANGDYHWGALTSSGRLYTWGAYSNGALGLGHPSLENTRLSSPRPPTSSSQRAPTSSVTTIPATATLPPQRIFTIPRLPRNPQILQPPSTTTRPTRVVFPGESLDDEAVAQEDETVENDSEEGKERSGKFVFNFSCGGSHSGVLAIDLSEDVVEDIVDDCEEVEVEEGEEERTEEGGVQGSSIFQFFNPFRIGFAGRPDRTD